MLNTTPDTSEEDISLERTTMQVPRVSNGHSSSIGEVVRKYLPDLADYEELYKTFHRHPELGNQEFHTSSVVKVHLESLGYDVQAGIGGTGVVGVMKNGTGKTVMLRADMDALPVEEATGLPYASRAHQTNAEGKEVPVMHACGHDMHVTCLLAVARLLRDARSEWSGTLICLFQPNEEGGGGAQGMVDDGLYKKVPIPDVLLGQHVDGRRTGDVAIRSGPFMAAADSFLVKIHGKGGHGSQPEFCVDPIVIAGYIIVRLQSIVSRYIAPADTAVVTVGAIHGGQAENVIANEVQLKINVRSYDPDVRKRVLDAIHKIVLAECDSANVPKEPEFVSISKFPVTDNDPTAAQDVRHEFASFFGEQRIEKMERLTGSEDFSELAKPNNTPYAFWFFGGTDAAKWDEAKKKGDYSSIPRNHMSTFAPVIEPTMRTGIQALSVAALHYLVPN